MEIVEVELLFPDGRIYLTTETIDFNFTRNGYYGSGISGRIKINSFKVEFIKILSEFDSKPDNFNQSRIGITFSHNLYQLDREYQLHFQSTLKEVLILRVKEKNRNELIGTDIELTSEIRREWPVQLERFK